MEEQLKRIAEWMTEVGLKYTSNGSWNFDFEEIAEWHNTTEGRIEEHAREICGYFNPEIVAEWEISGDQIEMTFFLEYCCQHCSSYSKRSEENCHSCECWCDDMAEDSDEWDDDSDRTCDDCPPEECNGSCANCYYRTV